jgi:hypothetical protein
MGISRRLATVRYGSLASLPVIIGIATLLAAGIAPAQAQETIAFRWSEAVRCGPEGTLRFDSGARLDLIDPLDGFFEFRGVAREESRQLEGYALTLTFIDWDDRVLFRIASEPFEMEPGRRTAFVVSGRELAIAELWDEIAAVDLDAEVPQEPLFEEAWDFYGGVLRYRGEQDLEGRLF